MGRDKNKTGSRVQAMGPNAGHLKSLINPKKIPRHIAIIMDGNGRWANKRFLPRIAGHKVGAETVQVIVEECVNLNVEALTLYAFSTENWSRPKKEVSFLMKLLVEFLKKELKRMHRQNVRLRVMGGIEKLPSFAREVIDCTIKETSVNTGLILNLALNYGSQIEIAGAARKISEDVLAGKISPKDIDEKLFSMYLYTADLPELDLLIRTSGEWRISNFLLWQLAYSEIYITNTFWPDFREEEFFRAVLDFQKRERRFGKTSFQISKEKKLFSSSC